MEKLDIQGLHRQAQKSRKLILRMLANAGSGHPGSSLSAIDLITVLFFREMRFRPQQPDWPDRDRFILSKGTWGSSPLCHPCLLWLLFSRGYVDP